MKYIVMLGDGMADEPVPELANRTPLQAANKPVMDRLAQNGEVGLVATTPEGMEIGSVTTNLGILGYNQHQYYTGRSPLEAISMGIQLKDTDVTLRMNLVNLSENQSHYEDRTMVDYSADEITTQEATELVQYLAAYFNNDSFTLYPGISYRHCLVWDHGVMGNELTPPHDIAGRRIGHYLPRGEGAPELLAMMKESANLLSVHPLNQRRKERGLKPANSVWFWGAGVKPSMPTMWEKYHKRGAMVSAVDLLKGLGICAGLDIIEVEGATGNIDTNFEGKAQAAIDALRDHDFVYIHVEAPDECGHRHEVENKVKAIEYIDGRILAPVTAALEEQGEPYHILVLPDHPTLLTTRGHSDQPVPYILYRSEAPQASGIVNYNEQTGRSAGNFIAHGYDLLDRLFAANGKE